MGLSNPLTKWTVYGRKQADVRKRVVTAGVHADRLDTLAAADAFLTQQIMLGGYVEAVIVELLYGEDKPHERRVIRRVNEGKAWWE